MAWEVAASILDDLQVAAPSPPSTSLNVNGEQPVAKRARVDAGGSQSVASSAGRHDVVEEQAKCSPATWVVRLKSALEPFMKSRQQRPLRIQSMCSGLATERYGLQDCYVKNSCAIALPVSDAKKKQTATLFLQYRMPTPKANSALGWGQNLNANVLSELAGA